MNCGTRTITIVSTDDNNDDAISLLALTALSELEIKAHPDIQSPSLSVVPLSTTLPLE